VVGYRSGNEEAFRAVIVALVLIGISIPLLTRQAKQQGDPQLFRLLFLALIVKLVGALLRYYVVFTVYGGLADATDYIAKGSAIASAFRAGHSYAGLTPLQGTNFVRLVAGLVFTVIGPSGMGGFPVFSWFAFWGLVFFYKAFRVAVPQGLERRYAYLVFFLPSLFFWPSSIGKDALAALGLGLASLGIAHVLSGNSALGALPAALGFGLTLMVRPHVAGILAIAWTLAAIARRTPWRARQMGPIVKTVTIVVATLMAILILNAANIYFIDQGVDTGKGLNTTEGIATSLTEIQTKTTKGGSQFGSVAVTGPVRFPVALVTVLFRPFVTEAHGLAPLAAALEGTFLLGYALWRWSSVQVSVRSIRTSPYLGMCMAYVVGFVVAFSTFSNFGILARQRIQVMPFFLALLCLPVKASATSRRSSTRRRSHQTRES